MKPRALVTGASRGIGAAIAETLARDGHPVVIGYRVNEAAALRVRSRIAEAGGQAELAPFDVRCADDSARALARLLDAGPIGVVVNNAGIAQDSPLPAMSRTAWTDVTRTVLDGFYNVTQPLLMPMVHARWGRIVNIASLSGVVGNRGQTNYAAAKAGLIGATRSLALELGKRRITVNAVAPGFIETDMLAGVSIDLTRIPLRRLGQPAEVAQLVRFLVSDAAAYITGQVIGINGGLA